MPCSSFQQFIRVNSVIAKKLGCHLKVAKRRCKAPYAVGKSACCTLPSDRWLKIQPTIAIFSANEFCQQPALSNNTGLSVGSPYSVPKTELL